MFDKLKEFISNNLGLVIGVGLAGLLVTYISLMPVMGNIMTNVLAYLLMIMNFFPYPLNWLLLVAVSIFVIKFIFRLVSRFIGL